MKEFSVNHLLGIKNLSLDDIKLIFDVAGKFKEVINRPIKKVPTLRDITVANLFFENSTRTKLSFELAEKRLSAEVINFSLSGSSLSKGETLVDTVNNILAMKVDIVVIRHPDAGAASFLSENIKASVINAGDGSHEHPTQALLDALTIKKRFGNFKKLKIAICGDILHSRVARSNIEILTKLGCKINVVGPKSLIPKDIEKVKVYSSMKEGLKNCDIVMMLRIQKERIISKYVPNEKIYFEKYGLDYNKLDYANKNAFVMHPGPMNRDVEIDSKLADDVTRSLIQEQVTMGVAIRMACLEILINNKDI